MKMVAGSILVLAGAVLASAGGISMAVFRHALMAHGGTPFFFFPDFAYGGAAIIGSLGFICLIWGAVTERKP